MECSDGYNSLILTKKYFRISRDETLNIVIYT